MLNKTLCLCLWTNFDQSTATYMYHQSSRNGPMMAIFISCQLIRCLWSCFTGELDDLVKHGLRALRDTLPSEVELTTKVCPVQQYTCIYHTPGAWVNSLWPSDAIWWQGSRSTLVQVMACCLSAPSHYLNQCWLIITKVTWCYHSHQALKLASKVFF